MEVFDCNSLNGTTCQGSDRPKAPLSHQVSGYIFIGNLQAPLNKKFLNFDQEYPQTTFKFVGCTELNGECLHVSYATFYRHQVDI